LFHWNNLQYWIYGLYYVCGKNKLILSLALQIHVSPFTKDILDKIGGYHLLHRGAVAMKVMISILFVPLHEVT